MKRILLISSVITVKLSNCYFSNFVKESNNLAIKQFSTQDKDHSRRRTDQCLSAIPERKKGWHLRQSNIDGWQ